MIASGHETRSAVGRSASSMTTEIFVVDDQELMRLSFRMVIDSQPDLKVTGEATCGAEAIAAARILRPDVMLMDVRMPDIDGLRAARQIIHEDRSARIILSISTRPTPGPRAMAG